MTKKLMVLVVAAVVAAGVSWGAANQEATAVKHEGRLVGWSLFDGKVLVNGNITGSAKYILENCPVDEKITSEMRASEHASLVKMVFPEALELRVQIDYGYGFPKGTKVRVTRPTDSTAAAVVDAPDGTWYFYTEYSTPYCRPGLFADGKDFLFAQEVAGCAPCGSMHESFYGVKDDDIQVKTAFSRVSVEDARRTLAAEQPDFLPMHRILIDKMAKENPEPLPMKGWMDNPSLDYIQRTMKKIAESTAEKPATVRVMFYGQSIVWQPWTRLMMRDLKSKYPTVNFVWKNLAIGGYGAEELRDCFKRDVIPFYPDILFFHDYGSVVNYAEMIRWAREETAAEIVLWTSHLRGSGWGSDPVELTKCRDDRTRGIIDVATKYHCHLIDLNRKWCQLFLKNKWNSNKLLVDGIHLNWPGIMQYRNFIEEELIRIPGADGDEDATGSERYFAVADKKSGIRRLADGTLEFTFKGNRVTAVSDGTAEKDLKAEVLLDGKPLAPMKELWDPGRPSAICVWFPGLHQSEFGPTPPVEEDWTLTFQTLRPGDPTNKVFHATGGTYPWSGKGVNFVPGRFTLKGSVTGEDGEGITTEPFVSKSGRVKIPVRAWSDWQQWPHPAPGRETRWSVHPLFTDVWTARPAGEEVLLLQGCSNTTHKLTIKLPKGAKSGIEGFRVWKPAGLIRASQYNWNTL